MASIGGGKKRPRLSPLALHEEDAPLPLPLRRAMEAVGSHVQSADALVAELDAEIGAYESLGGEQEEEEDSAATLAPGAGGGGLAGSDARILRLFRSHVASGAAAFRLLAEALQHQQQSAAAAVPHSSSSGGHGQHQQQEGEEEAPHNAPPPPQWPCPSCTYLNADRRRKCEVCGVRKPAAGVAQAQGRRGRQGQEEGEEEDVFTFTTSSAEEEEDGDEVDEEEWGGPPPAKKKGKGQGGGAGGGGSKKRKAAAEKGGGGGKGAAAAAPKKKRRTVPKRPRTDIPAAFPVPTLLHLPSPLPHDLTVKTESVELVQATLRWLKARSLTGPDSAIEVALGIVGGGRRADKYYEAINKAAVEQGQKLMDPTTVREATSELLEALLKAVRSSKCQRFLDAEDKREAAEAAAAAATAAAASSSSAAGGRGGGAAVAATTEQQEEAKGSGGGGAAAGGVKRLVPLPSQDGSDEEDEDEEEAESEAE